MIRKIANVKYEVVDALTAITVADSVIATSNKIGRGHGERKLYVGNENNELKEFFNDFKDVYHCFVLKEDLCSFMDIMENEYLNPSQEYRKKDEFPTISRKLKERINSEPNTIYFDMCCSDVERPRIYINAVGAGNEQTENGWNLIRKISLPNLTKLSIMKVKNDDNLYYYYFRLEPDFEILTDDGEAGSRLEEIKINEDIELSETEKKAIIQARRGQGKYRKELLEEVAFCPFTMVDDLHLLIASHIKPWKKSSNQERVDCKNGFIFTPTYDKLFDKGFISFTDDKKLIISPWLSCANIKRLNLKEGLVIEYLPTIDTARKQYLEYHRKNILKK